MNLRSPAFWLGALAVAAVTACTNGGGLGSIGGGGGGGSPSPLPSSSVIGLAIPTGKIGVENDPVWGTVAGFTQEKTTQVLAFAPGAKLTIVNLSKVDDHTLNVISKTNGPPPQWPVSPSLGFSPTGNGILGLGYASGLLTPGASVTITLSKPGTYLLGCAVHYVSNAMRDIIEVSASATPGPTASPGPGGYAKRRAATKTTARVAQPSLVDQRGHKFTLDSLRGEPLVITFVSAHCTDACPLIDGQFADAASRIERAHLKARLLTVTLDPEHDSPRTMREMAARFDADPRYWLLASGSIRNVHTVMHRFGVYSAEGKHGYRDEHTTFVYVMNRNGDLAQMMLASSALSDSIVDALRDPKLVAQR
jgi:protein SCO1/2